MATSYFPFDEGAGANVRETDWSKMAKLWRTSGVVMRGSDFSQGNLSVVPGTGLSVVVKAIGEAWIRGHYFYMDTDQTLTLSAANQSNPRIDRIVLRLDWVANTISLAILQGTPAATPAVPSLTQTDGSRWEIPLAQVYVGAGVSSITSANITDERTTSNHLGFVPACQVSTATDTSIAAGATATIAFSMNAFDPLGMHSTSSNNDKIYIKESGIYLVQGMLFWRNPTGNNIAGTVNTSIYHYKQSLQTAYQIARDTMYIAVSQGVQSYAKVINASAGDYVYIQATNNSSVPLNVDSATPYSPYLTVVKLGIVTGF